MKLDIVFPRLPPAIDGIGDHTVQLASGLAALGHDVRILTRRPDPSTAASLLRKNVEVAESWPDGNLRKTDSLIRNVAKRSPDWVMLQFEQFSYGDRGFNPSLSHFFSQARLQSPSTQFMLYAHENYTKASSPKKALLSFYQRRQFQNLTLSASLIAITTDAWRNGRDFHGVQPLTIPVFSNIPLLVPRPSASVRQQFDIPTDRPLAINFGNYDPSRASYILEAARSMAAEPYTFAYLGKDTEAMLHLLHGIENVHVVTVDRPTGEEISELLSSADISLAPFADGVTGRRGSFLAALQHGLPTVTTISVSNTFLSKAHRDGAFAATRVGNPAEYGLMASQLISDRTRLSRMSVQAADCYRTNFSIELSLERLSAEMKRIANFVPRK